MNPTDLILGSGSILVGIGVLISAALNRLPNQTTPMMSPGRRKFLLVAGVLLIVVGGIILAGVAPLADL